MTSAKSKCRYVPYILILVLILLFQFSATGCNLNKSKSSKLSLGMTLKEVAQTQSIMNPKSVATELGLDEPVSKRVPMVELGVSQKQLSDLEHHILSHNINHNLFFVYLIASILGIIYLLYMSGIKKGVLGNHKRYIYSLVLLSVIIINFIYGKSPNPMQSVSKMFKVFAGVDHDMLAKILVFGFFILVSVIANKIICGWACPAGSLQELIYSIPILKKLKSKKVPFKISNSIRVALFVFMNVFLFGNIFVRSGRVLYHELNIFNLFELNFTEIGVFVAIIVTLILSNISYRPFCNFICPFGLISWFFEKISILKIKIDKEKCIDCGKCENICPTHAASDYLNGKKMPADCYSCARCLDVCPTDAIKYKFNYERNTRNDK